MNKIKRTLWNDYDRVSNQIGHHSIDDKNYEMLLSYEDKIRNEIIKYELESKRNRNDIITTGVTAGLSLIGLIMTFKFDQTSTVTSTLGPNILKGFTPKLFRK